METKQLTLPFAEAPAPVLINFPLRQSDAELAALQNARKFPVRRRRADRFAFRWGLNRAPAVIAYDEPGKPSAA
jgi:hypothetical protein